MEAMETTSIDRQLFASVNTSSMFDQQQTTQISLTTPIPDSANNMSMLVAIITATVYPIAMFVCVCGCRKCLREHSPYVGLTDEQLLTLDYRFRARLVRDWLRRLSRCDVIGRPARRSSGRPTQAPPNGTGQGADGSLDDLFSMPTYHHNIIYDEAGGFQNGHHNNILSYEYNEAGGFRNGQLSSGREVVVFVTDSPPPPAYDVALTMPKPGDVGDGTRQQTSTQAFTTSYRVVKRTCIENVIEPDGRITTNPGQSRDIVETRAASASSDSAPPDYCCLDNTLADPDTVVVFVMIQSSSGRLADSAGLLSSGSGAAYNPDISISTSRETPRPST